MEFAILLRKKTCTVMVREQNMTLKLVELLAKKAATPEEKRAQALIKSALLSDSLLKFINEVEIAGRGFGKVHTQTVKDLVEYARAHNEAQIRTVFKNADDVESIVARENDRLTVAEVWALGALAYWGLLE